MKPRPSSPVILFDGVCNLCNGSVQFIIRHDRQARFRFAALQSESGQELLSEYGVQAVEPGSIVYLAENTVYTESGAVLRILRDLGHGWQCLYALIAVPACIRDAVYRMIARNRYRLFGKREACMVPSPALRERFL